MAKFSHTGCSHASCGRDKRYKVSKLCTSSKLVISAVLVMLNIANASDLLEHCEIEWKELIEYLPKISVDSLKPAPDRAQVAHQWDGNYVSQNGSGQRRACVHSGRIYYVASKKSFMHDKKYEVCTLPIEDKHDITVIKVADEHVTWLVTPVKVHKLEGGVLPKLVFVNLSKTGKYYHYNFERPLTDYQVQTDKESNHSETSGSESGYNTSTTNGSTSGQTSQGKSSTSGNAVSDPSVNRMATKIFSEMCVDFEAAQFWFATSDEFPKWLSSQLKAEGSPQYIEGVQQTLQDLIANHLHDEMMAVDTPCDRLKREAKRIKMTEGWLCKSKCCFSGKGGYKVKECPEGQVYTEIPPNCPFGGARAHVNPLSNKSCEKCGTPRNETLNLVKRIKDSKKFVSY